MLKEESKLDRMVKDEKKFQTLNPRKIFSKPPHLVSEKSEETAVAEDPGPLSDMGFGNYASANPGGDCDSLLSKFSQTIPQPEDAGESSSESCDEGMGGDGLLFEDSKPPRCCEGDCS